jgi:hypothetical protein
VGSVNRLRDWQQEMKAFELAFSQEEWEALKATGRNLKSSMQYIIREALSHYLSLTNPDLSTLDSSILEKAYADLAHLKSRIDEELQGRGL